MNSKIRSLLILAITAGGCARAMFAFIADPEGPNLLVVIGMAAVIFAPSVAVYLSKLLPSLTGFTRIAATVLIQIVVTAGFWLVLH